MTNGREQQGHNVAGDVFGNLGAVLLLAEGPACGGYDAQAAFLAAVAENASDGLRGKIVLDVMCRNGTGVLALARHLPRRIYAIDGSADQVAILNAIVGEGDLEVFLRRMGAPDILGSPLYELTLRRIERMRVELKTSAFWYASPYVVLQARHRSALQLTAVDLEGEQADVVVGGSYLHWAVNERIRVHMEKYPAPPSHVVAGSELHQAVQAEAAFRKAESLTLAWGDTLRPLHAVLKPRGVAVFLTPLDFTYDDNNPLLQMAMEHWTMVHHPVAVRMMSGISQLLQERHSIALPALQTSRLFVASRMEELFDDAGFTLERTCLLEGTFGGNVDPKLNAVDAFFVRFMLWLGKVNIPVAQKFGIAKDVVEALRHTVPPEELAVPIRGYYTAWVARKR